MDFRLLGPLEASERGRAVRLGGLRQRTVLAHLLVRANQVVSADRLIDEVWGDEPPQAARNALQSYVSRLRQLIGNGARIEGRPPGYVLRVQPERIDAVRFETLLQEGRRLLGNDPGAALEHFDEAMSLWRGPALADLSDELSLQGEIGRLEELRLGAAEDRIAAQLALGRHDELVAELESLVEEYPVRERLWGYLMLALYRSGRQAEALASYQRARRLLADELGLDPSPELRQLQGGILRQDPVLEPEAQRLRGYRLLEPVGAGSFGVVYRATQPHVGREVAAKVINPALANDPRFVRRFEAEAQVVARLEHPHIVPLYDYWREPGGAYLVMRLLRGGNLKRALEEGPLAPERAVALVGQVASGLAVAHRLGIVHRDVKPANILLDEDGNAYLSDFGIAIDVAAEVTSPTPDSVAYVSPEQRRGEACTPRTDVYSLGVVLQEALAGTTVAPGIAEVIARATAEEAVERYSDAEALTAALQNAVPATTTALTPARNPYKGLRPFEEADATDFFGRESLVDRLVGRLEGGATLLALVGASGSGKSSAVRAGLFPALRRGAVPGSSDWFLVEMSPGTQPVEQLEAALLTIATDAAPALREHRESELLLFVDQLEELYTLVEDAEERERFLDELAAAADDPESRVRVVVTLRADFYDRPLEHPALANLLRSGIETIVPLSPQEVERAVTGPATRVGAHCEPSLVAEIVADVSLEPSGALPLLQYALTELFERRRDGTLALAAYREVGGLAGAVARRAEQLYEEAGGAGREAVRQLFLRLVAVSAAAEQTRRRVSRSELAELEVDQTALEDTIEAFGRHRLLSFDRDPESRTPTVEVAHEALLSSWERLRGWIDEAQEDVRMRARLAASAREWDSSERDPSFLLAGTRLELFDAWASTSSIALARTERDYLDASRAKRDAERAEEQARRAREVTLERRSQRRLRALAIVLSAAALAAAGLSLFAFGQREEAQTQATRAAREARLATARELASAALANLDDDPERSILLALVAVETTRSADGTVLREAEEALHDAVQSTRVLLAVPGAAGADGTAAIAFSPNGKYLATIGRKGAVNVWSAVNGSKLLPLPDPANQWEALDVLSKHRGRITALAFSRGGSRFATAGADGAGRVWDTKTGRQLATIRRVGQPSALALSPDGTRLVTADGTAAVVWDLATRRPVRRLEIPAFGVAFSPDGSRLAVVGLSGLVSVWSATLGRRLLSASGHDGSHVRSVDFGLDGAHFATAGDDGTVRVWEAETAREQLVLPGQGAAVDLVAFSPDGSRVAGCCGGARAMVWDVSAEGSRELVTFAAHDAMVFNIAFSPDGRRLATASEDGSARVWDATSGKAVLTLSGHDGPVSDIVFSPDGRRLATTGFDRTARLWSSRTGKQLSVLRGHTAPVWGASFSLDGRRLATVSEDRTGRIWETEAGRTARELHGHAKAVYDVTYSRDGSRIATVGDDRTARIWDAASGRQLRALRGHAGNIVQAAFSPDGGRLATAGLDGARVWDVGTGKQLYALSRHGGGVIEVDFSPDGERLATASLDGAGKLWDSHTGRELISLREAGRLAFSPDGAWLAVASGGTARVYALRIDDLIALARRRVTRGLTDDECRQYLHRDRCPD